jgi:hypothetical protein
MTDRDMAPEPDADSGAGRSVTPAEVAVRALTQPPPVRVVRQSGQRTAALRQELAEKAAATDELREALDQLRQVLDIDNAPPRPDATHHRARFVAVLAAALAVVGLAGYLLVDWGTGDHRRTAGTPAAAASPVTSPVGATGDGGGPSGTASGPTGGPTAAATVRPLPWPGGAVVLPPGLVTSGPGADAPGTDVQAALDDDGVHVDVVERLVVATPDGGSLALTAATLPGLGTTTISALQVQLDGDVVPVTATGGGWTARRANGSWTHAVLRYRIGGGLVTVTPAALGRALGLVAPLTAALSQAGGHPVQVRTLDPRVVGISCPAVQGTGAVCGSRTSGGWTASVPGSARPVVLLQITR